MPARHLTTGTLVPFRRLPLDTKARYFMGTTTVGALIGGAIDSMSGDDGAADGAIIGAVTANVLKLVVPVVVTYAVGWAVLRGAEQLREQLFQREKTA